MSELATDWPLVEDSSELLWPEDCVPALLVSSLAIVSELVPLRAPDEESVLLSEPELEVEPLPLLASEELLEVPESVLEEFASLPEPLVLLVPLNEPDAPSLLANVSDEFEPVEAPLVEPEVPLVEDVEALPVLASVSDEASESDVVLALRSVEFEFIVPLLESVPLNEPEAEPAAAPVAPNDEFELSDALVLAVELPLVDGLEEDDAVLYVLFCVLLFSVALELLIDDELVESTSALPDAEPAPESPKAPVLL